MFKKIAMVVAVLIAAILAFAATRPDTFRVQRAASIKAPPEKVFALLNDFQRWEAWSPWEKKDPAMKRTFSVVTSGKGAQYAWEGNKDVGQGRDQAGLRQAVRSPQHGRVHARAQRRGDERHLGHAGRHALSREDRPRVPEHGQDGRQGLRGGSGQPQGRGRKVNESPSAVSIWPGLVRRMVRARPEGRSGPSGNPLANLKETGTCDS